MRSKLLSILKKDGIKTEYLEIHKRNLLSKNNTVKKVDIKLLTIEDIINIGLAHAQTMNSDELFIEIKTLEDADVEMLQLAIGANYQSQMTMYFYKGDNKYDEIVTQVDVYKTVVMYNRRELRRDLYFNECLHGTNWRQYNLTPLLS